MSAWLFNTLTSCYVYKSGVITDVFHMNIDFHWVDSKCDLYLYYPTTVKKCSPVFFPVTGNVTCVYALEPFSFGSRCNFTCQEGYYQTRDNTFTCLASGQWSNPTPTCTGGSQKWCQGSAGSNPSFLETDKIVFWWVIEFLLLLQWYSATVYRLHPMPPCNARALSVWTAMAQYVPCDVKKDLMWSAQTWRNVLPRATGVMNFLFARVWP